MTVRFSLLHRLPLLKSDFGSGFSQNFYSAASLNCPRSWLRICQRWPKSLFQTPTPLLFQKFWIRIRVRVRKFFNIEKTTPVQTPATIDATGKYQWFYLRNDHADSCYCRNWKVTPNLGSVFQQIVTPNPGSKEKWRTGTSEPWPLLVIAFLCSRLPSLDACHSTLHHVWSRGKCIWFSAGS